MRHHTCATHAPHHTVTTQKEVLGEKHISNRHLFGNILKTLNCRYVLICYLRDLSGGSRVALALWRT